MKKEKIKIAILDVLAVILTILIFIIPFYFLIINSFKNAEEALFLNIDLPITFNIVENYKEVLGTNNGILIRAFQNSLLLTFFSVIGVLIISAMAGFVLQRRKDKFSGLWNFMILFGLMAPPAIVPTIWVLKALNIYKTLFSMILIEICLRFPFSVLLYKGFIKTIPKELDEAAILEGCGPLRLFFQIIFPLLKPINITIIVVNSLRIYNDFMNPLYFFPGARNITVQLTLFQFITEIKSQWNLLFASVVLISIPPLILYIFLNKRIMSGMTAGSLKG